jgi:hypothetical protein
MKRSDAIKQIEETILSARAFKPGDFYYMATQILEEIEKLGMLPPEVDNEQDGSFWYWESEE